MYSLQKGIRKPLDGLAPGAIIPPSTVSIGSGLSGNCESSDRHHLMPLNAWYMVLC
jgi:hypothetical protein